MTAWAAAMLALLAAPPTAWARDAAAPSTTATASTSDVAPALAEIERLGAAARNPRSAPEARLASAEAAVEARAALLRDRPGDPRAPDWRLDQAEDLLLLVLPADGSDLMAMAGRPSPQQRAAAQRRIAEASEWLREAAPSAAPSSGGETLSREARPSGREEPPPESASVRRRRLDLLRGVAAALAADLADDDAAARRKREEAVAILAPMFIDLEPGPRRLAYLHAGRVLAGLGRRDEADALLALVEEDAAASEAERLAAQLSRVLSHAGALGDESANAFSRLNDHERAAAAEEARRRLEAVSAAHAADSAFTRLLLADAEARLRLVVAGGEAWRPYRKLLADSGGREREALRPLVLERVGSLRSAATPSEELAPLEAVAAAATLCSDPARRDEGLAQIEALLERRGVPGLEQVLATMVYAEALVAQGRRADAARALASAAAAHADTPEAAASIERAAELASAQWHADPSNGAVRALLGDVLATLFARFERMPSIDRWRIEAGRVALAEGRLEDVGRAVTPIEATSAFHPAAMVLAATARAEAARRAAPEERAAAWSEALREAEAATTSLERALSAQPAGASPEAARAQTQMTMLRVEALLALGEADAALRALDQATGVPGLSEADAVELDRLRVEALEHAGRGDDAQAMLAALSRRAPRQAAATIVRLLAAGQERVDLLKADRPEAAQALAERRLLPLVDALTPLVDRPAGQPEALEPSTQLAANWLIARACISAGRPGQALTRLDALLREQPDALEYLAAKAECLEALGGEARLAEAMAIHKRISAGRREARDRWFWQAEASMLEILRRVNRHTEEIGPRIEQLRLLDPELGGAETRRRFEALIVTS